jgi:hypothetical protein
MKAAIEEKRKIQLLAETKLEGHSPSSNTRSNEDGNTLAATEHQSRPIALMQLIYSFFFKNSAVTSAPEHKSCRQGGFPALIGP